MKNITQDSLPQVPEETIKLIDELNDKSQTDAGQWLFSNDLGVVWKPKDAVFMPGRDTTLDYPLPEEKTAPPLLESIVKWGETYDFDNIPKNAVVLIKLNVKDPMRVQMMQRAIAKQVLEPRVEKLKAQQVCVLFVQSDDDISVMTEEDMNKAGWEKKDKKRIITLDA